MLEYATRALSEEAGRKFARYWRVIKPGGAFVSLQLLKSIRRRAQRDHVTKEAGWTVPVRGRSVHATRGEAALALPGDDLIPHAKGVLNHAITIQRPPHEIWPWLAQMGAGSRAGWYSYDVLDNAHRPSADCILPELQQLSIGMIFPALPGATDGFTLLAFAPDRFLVLGWLAPGAATPLMTWAFVLEEAEHGSTRLLVRARVGDAYEFHGLPWWLGRPTARIVHFVMQRKQLLGIAERVERSASGEIRKTDQTSAGRKAVA